MIRRFFARIRKLMRKHAICRGAKKRIDVLDYRTCRLEKHASFIAEKNSKLTLGPSVAVEAGTLLKAFGGGCLTLCGRNYINRNCAIVAKESIVLQEGVTIGPGTVIYDHDHDMEHTGNFLSAPVCIEKNAWIGANVIILKGVTIGEGSVVAAGTVVTKDIPPHTTVYDKREKVIVPHQAKEI